MCDKVGLHIPIAGLIPTHGCIVLSKSLLFGYVWVQVQEVSQVCNHISQWTDGKGFTGKWLQHEHITLVTGWRKDGNITYLRVQY